jgi:DNA-binding MarR family transcriptional regulator
LDPIAQRDLKILSAIEAHRDMTQRRLSKSLGIALGLTNLYLKRLVRKGYVKITTIPPNRIGYLVTPRGFAEKTRLTYEYMTLSLTLYQETREVLRAALRPLLSAGQRRVALYGTGEAAELAYLTLREIGVDPIGVYADGNGATFLGMRVSPVAELAAAEIDQIVVATFSITDEELATLRKLASSDRLIFLRAPAPARMAAR